MGTIFSSDLREELIRFSLSSGASWLKLPERGIEPSFPYAEYNALTN